MWKRSCAHGVTGGHTNKLPLFCAKPMILPIRPHRLDTVFLLLSWLPWQFMSFWTPSLIITRAVYRTNSGIPSQVFFGAESTLFNTFDLIWFMEQPLSYFFRTLDYPRSYEHHKRKSGVPRYHISKGSPKIFCGQSTCCRFRFSKLILVEHQLIKNFLQFTSFRRCELI